MAILSDRDIKKYVKFDIMKIFPYEESNVQAATIDLRIGKKFLVPDYCGQAEVKGIISLNEDLDYREVESERIIIPSHQFILGTTLEEIALPNNLAARVDGKSRIGRRGLFIQNAGHIGPGFQGEITLELYNANQLPIEIVYGQPICQLEFHELSSHSKGYSGQFQGQRGPRT